MKLIRGTLWTLALAFVLIASAPQALAACWQPDLGEGQLADVALGATSVEWRLFVEHASVTLTLSTPCGTLERTYDKGDNPVFDLRELAPDDPDGNYFWQLRIEPVVSGNVKEALLAYRATGNEEILKDLCREGLLPKGPFIQTGAFAVIKGAILEPSNEEMKEKLQVRRSDDVAARLGVVKSTEPSLQRVVAKDQVFYDDVIVDGSLCVGFDCVNGEDFGYDTLRLKENNLRIHVDDTSTISGYPNTDWRLEFNASASGGGSYFRVVDASHSRNIMTLEANAPSHSLYVDDGGRVGFGTSTPYVELHVVDGDTPTLRLQQDGSSGFAAQTWDVAANETNFFVRDVTGGSQLSFRIFPGADSNTLVLDHDSEVGIGTASPDADLNVVQSNSTSGFHLQRNGNPVTMLFEDTSANQKWEFKINSAGSFAINDPAATGGELILDSGGNLDIKGEITTSGSCAGGCDRVFAPDYALESIDDHARSMWANSYLPGVGPTPEGSGVNLSQKTTGMLNELEKAHIYIEQLHARLQAVEAQLAQQP